MPTTLAVANQKGGVGKTTSVVNLAAFASLAGHEVLVVDLDPQGNASSVLAPDYDGPSLFGGGVPQEVAGLPGLHVLARGNDLMAQERRIGATIEAGRELGGRLGRVGSDAELILIDCPPSLALLPGAALMAADRVLIPIQCEYYAMEGLGQILAYLAELQEDGLYDVALGGILLTMFDQERALDHAVAGEVREHFGAAVFESVVPRDVALAAAPSHARTIIDHDPLSPGGLAYLAATKELLDGLE